MFVGYNPEGGDFVGTSVTFPGTDESDKHRPEVPSGAKCKQKINIHARNPGKSSLQKNPNREARWDAQFQDIFLLEGGRGGGGRPGGLSERITEITL